MPSGWSSILAILVLVSSLAFKLAVHDVSVEGDQRVTVAVLAGSLTRQGYEVSIPRGEVPALVAKHDNCSFTARVLDPHGTYHDTEFLKLQSGWSIIYVWRGRLSKSLPRLRPLVEYYISREIGRIGFFAERRPVVMVRLQPGCAPPDPAALNVREVLRELR